jgi:hypothetical protein
LRLESCGKDTSQMKAKTFCASRRILLQAAVAAGGGAALIGLSQAGAQTTKPKPSLAKRPKEKVGYRDQPYEGRSCAKCVLYVGNGQCVIVEGEVSPDGWCMQWTPATMGRRSGPPQA